MGKSEFLSKNSDFNETIQVICCFVLISRKWVGLDIFNNKWGYKHYLNAAKRENFTRRSEVVKNLHDVLYSSCVVFAGEKLRSCSELTFQYNRS